jgi:L-threonylcarbamoyladenylate synthase
MTDVLDVDPTNPDPAAIDRAARCLRDGGLVAFPTETVYGLGVNARDREALRRLFIAKDRPFNDPLIVHVASFAQVDTLVTEIPDAAPGLAQRFWPGPLTLVMHRSSEVPDEVTAGGKTVAIRVPAHPVARALLVAADLPIAAPSANRFSRPSPTRGVHVLEDLQGRIDLLLDAGPTHVGMESTVLDLTAPVPRILRLGAVTPELLRAVLPDVRMDVIQAANDEVASLPAPGLLTRHYSPKALLTLYEGDRRAVLSRIAHDARQALGQNKNVGILVAREDNGELGNVATRVIRLSSADDSQGIAAELYAALRELDQIGVDVILVRGFPAETGLGLAIQDRLRRAAGGRLIRCEEESGT